MELLYHPITENDEGNCERQRSDEVDDYTEDTELLYHLTAESDEDKCERQRSEEEDNYAEDSGEDSPGWQGARDWFE